MNEKYLDLNPIERTVLHRMARRDMTNHGIRVRHSTRDEYLKRCEASHNWYTWDQYYEMVKDDPNFQWRVVRLNFEIYVWQMRIVPAILPVVNALESFAEYTGMEEDDATE